MEQNEIYKITDIHGMAAAMREDVFETGEVGIPHESIGMDGYVTVGQIEAMIRDVAEHVAGEMYIDLSRKEKVDEMIVDAITSSALARLAAQDLIEVAWSDEENTFVYFKKEVAE